MVNWKLMILMIFILMVFPFVNANIVSVNYGGSKNIIVSSGGNIEGFFSGETTEPIASVCGNEIVESGEQCDDGNVVSGDGCSDSCTVEGDEEVIEAVSGGGGAVIPKFAEIKVVPELFNIPATAEVTGFGKLSVSNIGEVPLDINMRLVNLEGVIEFEKTNFTLKEGEADILEFKILPQENPGIYAGKIILTSGTKKLEIPIAINVKSEISLFDISVEISEKDNLIEINQTLKGQIILIQAGLQEKSDVVVIYLIKDFDGNTYSETSETIMVFKEKSYKHEFPTQNLPPGDYLIGAEVIYQGGVATASHQFKVVSQSIKKSYFIIFLEIIAGLIMIIFIMILIKKYKNKSLLIKSKK